MFEDLDKKIKTYLTGDDECIEEIESPEEIRKKIYEELESSKSGWSENTVGFSLNELRND